MNQTTREQKKNSTQPTQFGQVAAHAIKAHIFWQASKNAPFYDLWSIVQYELDMRITWRSSKTEKSWPFAKFQVTLIKYTSDFMIIQKKKEIKSKRKKIDKTSKENERTLNASKRFFHTFWLEMVPNSQTVGGFRGVLTRLTRYKPTKYKSSTTIASNIILIISRPPPWANFIITCKHIT